MQYFLGPERSALFLLIAEVIILIGLLYGFYLIRYRRKLNDHKRNQTAVVLINMGLILVVMVIGFYRYVVQGGAANPALARGMIVHAAFGAVAELMGLYLLVRMNIPLPEWLEVKNFKAMMRATMGLWIFVALGGFGIHYGQYVAASGEAGPGKPGVEATTSRSYGIAAWFDAQGFNDRVSLMVAGLPPPSSRTVYQGWLISPSSGIFESLGVMEVDGDGTGLLEYRSQSAANLLTSYDRVLITMEQAPAARSGPSSSMVLLGEIPPQVASHLRELLVEGPGSSIGLGFADALSLHGPPLMGHLREIESARRRGNLASAKRHAEHVINLIEGGSGKNYGDLNGDSFTQDPGDGVGLLAYCRLVSEHARLAMNSPDATPAVKSHGPHIITMAGNVSRWATLVRDDALAVIGSTGVQSVGARIDDAVSLSGRIYRGFDENGDGEVSAIPNEGGITQIHAHAKMMTRLVLHIGDGGPAESLRRQAPVPAPSPLPPLPPGTVRVLMPGMEFKEKTIVISKGTTVMWLNNDDAKHTVTANDRRFFSDTMDPGDTFSYTFNEAGRFPYYCDFHGDTGGLGMAGLVIVE